MPVPDKGQPLCSFLIPFPGGLAARVQFQSDCPIVVISLKPFLLLPFAHLPRPSSPHAAGSALRPYLWDLATRKVREHRWRIERLPYSDIRVHATHRLCWGPQLRLKVFRPPLRLPSQDRKSTRLNSSHSQISYAVFCLKKKRMKH